MREKIVRLYTFDELNDKAKDKAREWLRSHVAQEFSDDRDEFVLEDSRTIGAIFGLTKIDIAYSGFSCQGDGASFTGAYTFAPDACARIREHAPQDSELHTIADSLAQVQEHYAGTLQATIARDRRSHYAHDRTVSIVVESTDDDRTVDETDSTAIAETLRQFMRWIYRSLEAEYDYQLSNEAIDEAIRANEYEFRDNGKVDS